MSQLRARPCVGAVIIALALCAGLFVPRAAAAQTPPVDLGGAHLTVEHALEEVREGDLPKARALFSEYAAAWSKIEDDVRAASPALYLEMETEAGAVMLAFARNDAKAAQTALEQLEETQEQFINSSAGAAGDAEEKGIAQSPAMLLGELSEARAFQSIGNYAKASEEMKHFQAVWLNVEGQIKMRSAAAYRDTENDMALAVNLIAQQSPESAAVLERMTERLAPFAKPQANYGVFDAAIIILREGLEALLVIVALLTFLKKSGNADKSKWVWGGVAAGVLASVAIGVGIQIAFQSLITPANRELVEGLTSLAAAGMLIYVSYWMHSKSSTEAWNYYIKQRSTQALAAGSLTGLAALAFLSIFREGAETVLFFVGMASSISTVDLLTGLAIGLGALLVLGVLLIRLGNRLPISTFFGIASVLVFYLCFKFVGTGIHALLVAGVVPATPAPFLPESSFLGMYPTWETFIPQMILLGVGIGVAIANRVRFAAMKRAAAAA